jgi:biopolymer transport protein TolQ
VSSGRSLEEVDATSGDDPSIRCPRCCAWRSGSGRAPATGALNEAQGQLVVQRIDRGLDGVIARESQRVEDGLGSLAIVATASPFIGLFGTVWGIMNAFQASRWSAAPT